MQEIKVHTDGTLYVTDILPTVPDWVIDYIERDEHSDTMQALTPAERQALEDYVNYFAPIFEAG